MSKYHSGPWHGRRYESYEVTVNEFEQPRIDCETIARELRPEEDLFLFMQETAIRRTKRNIHVPKKMWWNEDK